MHLRRHKTPVHSHTVLCLCKYELMLDTLSKVPSQSHSQNPSDCLFVLLAVPLPSFSSVNFGCICHSPASFPLLLSFFPHLFLLPLPLFLPCHSSLAYFTQPSVFPSLSLLGDCLCLYLSWGRRWRGWTFPGGSLSVFVS